MLELQSPPDYFGQFMAPLQRNRALDIQQQDVNNQTAQAQAQAAKLQAGVEAMHAYQQDAAQVISNPSPEGYRALMLKYPEMHDSLKSAWDNYGEDQKQRDTEAASQVYAALANGRSDLALQLLKDRKTAHANAGQDDKITDSLIDLVESGDPAKIKQAQGMAGFALASSTGPDKIGSMLEALGSGGGDYTLSPGSRRFDANNNLVAEAPYSPQYRDVETVGPDGKPVTQIVKVGGEGGGGSLDPREFFKAFVLPHEGGYAPHDGNGAPVKYGINQKANPGVDVKNLTPDKASDIFVDKYWNASGAENLPPALAAMHADTYYINPDRAQRILAASGGDPDKYMKLRENWLGSLAKQPKYARFAKAWNNRNADLRQFADGLGGAAPAQAQAVYSAPKPGADEEGGLDQSTATFYAQQVLAGSPMPTLGMGKSAAAARQQIMKEVARLAGTEGLTGADQATQMSHYKAATHALNTLETQAGTIQQSEQTALLNGQQFLERSKELPGQTSMPALNSVVQFGQRNLPVAGHDTVVAMDAAWKTFTTEYAKVVGGSPSGAGVLSDSARHEAEQIMRGNYAYSQKVAAFNQMKADMANRMSAIHSTIAGKYDQLTKNPRSASQIAAQADLRGLSAGKGSDNSGLPKGAKVVGTYHGKRVIEVNGKRMVEQ
jgi:hypothetical protein